ncbi:fungal specific transcription factor domain-containing protein [Colletotrichum abscissum]|uniref:Fungal specific transcription factor domain-containing protein n=1 Tax=Colletotrichum abscissum TaxID=1671311 RepID=A0A9P9XLA1_9PEZI|nr:fungal specific transcription factor domain-containing protein [Colletotrichum abscissum]
MSASVVRSTALRAGGACVRCRKGKTKCVYENGRAPCKNCAKGMHECYLPSESMAHHHGQSPARHTAAHRPARESLPASVPAGDVRAANPASTTSRHVQTPEKLTPELIQECERVISKTYPACVAFHKPSFIQQLKNASLDPALIYALLTCAARSSPTLIRRYGGQSGATGAAEHFAAKAMGIINQNLDTPSLAEIQAICLIIIHEWGSRNAVRAYIYLGQASRMVQMYRILHSHHAAVSDADRFLQDESFRRVLWLLYILDCLLTSTPGRQPALSANDTADVSLPCSDMNFAFGNAVYVQTINLSDPSRMPSGSRTDEVGEFGQIVMATRIWRDVVQMLMTTTTETFNDNVCTGLMGEIERLRASLSMQYVDKPGQINLHITMGSGFTYAMLHCMLHCASIFINRRRLLQYVTAPGFNLESWRLTPQCHDIIDRLFTSCHSTIAMLTALETGFDKEGIICFPIFMLFSSFTASATVAYLSLKGLTPPNAVETAGHIVRDGLHFMQDGVDTWPLISSWLRHLAVMHRVLGNDAVAGSPSVAGTSVPPTSAPPADQASVKDEAASNPDTNPDAMDYDQTSNSNAGTGAPVPPAPANNHTASVSESGRESGRDSEPPAPLPRRPGVTTINGGSGGVGTPASVSPPPPQPAEIKQSTEMLPQPPIGNGVASAEPSAPVPQDMTASELCSAFERQLLELDDLAAFMGGGV